MVERRRWLHRFYGGSTFSPLADCCSACFPDQSQISRLNTDHRALNKEELASATLQLNNWKVKRWAEKLGSRRSIFGPVQLLPNVDLKRLAEKLPLVTTFERFGCVMEGWKSLEEEGDQLWKCARQIMDSIVAEREKDKAVKAAATAKKQASQGKCRRNPPSSFVFSSASPERAPTSRKKQRLVELQSYQREPGDIRSYFGSILRDISIFFRNAESDPPLRTSIPCDIASRTTKGCDRAGINLWIWSERN